MWVAHLLLCSLGMSILIPTSKRISIAIAIACWIVPHNTSAQAAPNVATSFTVAVPSEMQVSTTAPGNPAAPASPSHTVYTEAAGGSQWQLQEPTLFVEEPPSFADRLPFELLGGLAGATLTLGGGYLVQQTADDDLDGAIVMLASWTAGTAFAVPLGVTLGGNAAGGDASYWSVFIGGAAGMGLGVLSTIGLVGEGAGGADPLLLGGALIGTLSLLGSLAAYEIADRSPSVDVAEVGPPPSTFTIQPSAAIVPKFEKAQVSLEAFTVGVTGTM